MSFDDDDDVEQYHGSTSLAAPADGDNSSENEMDTAMDDVDEGDGDGEGDGEGEGESDDEDSEDDDQDDAESPSALRAQNRPQQPQQQPQQPPQQQPERPAEQKSVSPFRPTLRPEAITASTYDIVPTVAAPHSTSINAICAPPNMKYVFSGGSDGYIRKFNWPDTVNGKLMLTVAQRHPFVDSVTKAGVLLSYWDNEESSASSSSAKNPEDSLNLSPIYSLAVHYQALWLLSGTESGAINLQAVRHGEGTIIHTLRKHTSAVSVLNLAPEETSVLSGSWDKMIHDWDLNTGQIKRTYATSGGQISAIERRPLSSLPVPQDAGTSAGVLASTTFSSNNAAKPTHSSLFSVPAQHDSQARNAGSSDAAAGADAMGGLNLQDAPGSPDDDMNSLFGDDDAGAIPALGDDDDDEFSRALANSLNQEGNEDMLMQVDASDGVVPSAAPTMDTPQASSSTAAADSIAPAGVEAVGLGSTIGTAVEPSTTNPASDVRPTLVVEGGGSNDINGTLPNSEYGSRARRPSATASTAPDSTNEESLNRSDSTFLDASFDGTIRVWDRRMPNPVARIHPPRGTPPWCMSACWSPDGNFIYAGRRNNAVDEYSLHRNLSEPRRTFRFPAGSGPVSAVKAMPNGKHLICASYDILRLYDLKDAEEPTHKHAVVPFLIVPGHRTGVISQLFIDPTCSFLISTGGNRGWEGTSTEVLLGYEIGISRPRSGLL